MGATGYGRLMAGFAGHDRDNPKAGTIQCSGRTEAMV